MGIENAHQRRGGVLLRVLKEIVLSLASDLWKERKKEPLGWRRASGRKTPRHHPSIARRRERRRHRALKLFLFAITVLPISLFSAFFGQ